MTDLASVGHHFIVGLSGPALSDLDKKILEELKPSGILLLKRNFLTQAPYPEWLAGMDSLISSVKEYTERSRMIISIDHEGGRVHRTPAPLTHFPEAAGYCGNAFEVGRAMAAELRSIGVNVSWSPVCDIHSNPANPIIGTRAFGSDPRLVADAASRFARGLLENGVAACAKHFPGHGDTSVDSHKELPVLSLTLGALELRELVPFARLIDEGIPLVMTSHIVFPEIDPGVPATLSKKILGSLLRERLGFSGLIVTDDLDMNAVSMHHSSEALPVSAARAGCELFIVARYPDGSSDKPLAMSRALSAARESDNGLDSALDAAREKIDFFLRHAAGQYPVTELSREILAAHAALAALCR